MRRTERCLPLRAIAISTVAAVVAYGSLGASGAQAQRIAPPGSAAERFHKLLPPVASIPWLDVRLNIARAAMGLPQAGTLEALLLKPTPATRWPSEFRTEAANLRSYQR